MKYDLHNFKAGDVLTAEQLNRLEAALQIVMSTALPIKVTLIKGDHGELDIYVKGLVPDQTYYLQFYRKRKKFGWEMMWNTQTNASNSGYMPQLAGSKRTKQRDKNNNEIDGMYEYFQNTTPDWMPNGVLATRYAITASSDGEAHLPIDLSTWILDFLRPAGAYFDNIDQFTYFSRLGISGTTCTMIGTTTSKDCCVRFKVGVLQLLPTGEFDLIGLSDDILKLSGEKKFLFNEIEGQEYDKTSSSQIIVTNDPDKGIRAANLAVRIE